MLVDPTDAEYKEEEDDPETDQSSGSEDVCTELRGIAAALTEQKAPVVHAPVTVQPAPVTVVQQQRPKSSEFKGTYGGKPFNLTVTHQY